MARFKILRLAYDSKALLKEEFCRSMACLKSLEEIRSVFDDLCSTSEIVMFMRRIHVARMMMEGISYKEIAEVAGASKSLIRSVAGKIARSGEGFAAISDRLEIVLPEIRAEIDRNLKAQDPESFESHMRTYSRYYGFSHLAREAPKFIRNMSAARGRRKSLAKRGP